MINLVIVKNPFKTDKEVKQVDYVPGRSIYSYIQPEFMGAKVVISRNGEIVPEEEYNTLIPSDGDYIAACPVIEGSGDTGKDIGRTLAIIALSIVTMGVGSLVAGGAFWGAGAIGAANWGFWSWVAAAGVQIAGGYLINQVFPPQQGGEQFDRKQTYGWSQMPPISTEGEAIPVTFGTVRMGVMAPIQMLTQRITTNGEKQYLNLLMSGGEGPIDSITDLKINDNPYNYYDGVEYEIRYGTNDQSVISNFNDTYFPHSISYKLEEDAGPSIHQLSGEYEGLEVVVNFPAGLYHIDESDGDVESNEVKIEIKYREIGASTWTSWGIKTISGKYTHAIQRVYSKHELPRGEYEVSVECTYKKYDGSSDGHDVYWTSVSGIIYDDFSYPNKALVGLKALATDQLSGGIPRISWTQTRENVWVWNPSSGTYEQKPANNPAWACYDIIHRCRRLKNINTGTYEYVVNGIPANRIDYQSFVDWADFCTDRGIEYNGIIYNIQTLWDALRAPEQAGRGRVLMRGTKFSCICDAPSEPVQLFTVSNIGIDSFKEEYLGTSERANAIELTFYNIDNNYEETTIPIYGPGYDESTAVSNPTQVRLDFAMTLEQAYRYGAYQLRVNHYINRMVSWTADIDAIACQAGDVVLLQHDVPRWGYGGRIVSSTESTITLNQEVTLTPDKNYGIMIRYSDDTLVEKTVQNVTEEITTNTLTITEPFETQPVSGDIYSFGEVEKIAKPFRIVSISRDDDFRCTLQGMEYIEEVYNEETDIPIIDYTRSGEKLPNPWEPPEHVENLQVEEGSRQLGDGTWVATLIITFEKPSNVRDVDIYIRETGSQQWNYKGTTKLDSFVIDLVELKKYDIRVVSKSRTGIEADFETSPTIEGFQVTGKKIPPSPPIIESVRPLPAIGGFTIKLKEAPENDWNGFLIYISTTKNFEPSEENFKEQGKSDTFNITGMRPGVYYIKAKSIDTSKNLSESSEEKSIRLTPNIQFRPTQITFTGDTQQGTPDIVKHNNRLLVVYQEGVGETRSIYIRDVENLSWTRVVSDTIYDQRNPKIISLQNGDLFCVFDTDEETPRAIVGMRSTDGGETWGDRVIVAQELNNPVYVRDIIQTYNGEILVAYHTSEGFNDNIGIKVVKSRDNGYTWLNKVTVYENGASPNIAEIEPGHLVCAFQTQEDNLTDDIKLIRSIDGGVTWGNKRTIISSETRNYRYPSIGVLPNGQLIVVFFYDPDKEYDNASIWVKKSLDMGDIWESEPIFLYGGASKPASNPKIHIDDNGLIHCVFHTLGYDITRQFYNVAYLSSADGGSSWQGLPRDPLYPNTTLYPSSTLYPKD